ncbi:MAG: 3-dehydroquinate synthase [Caldilineaceae bacterium]|nr:3-dehydroquinate synthase [Caldilineaceae bacterium]MBP8108536.1 3-dehydroquinate synthase [Caldilineaceae bacterium]MBP8123528.1 3-dehydroquinate synthase [Caldilineaceae bacterium]MBP9074815.1 3-dehydroquinate synthase [Caldilineaceae bacterium]
MTPSNIILTGFMGTGKTKIGRMLAETLDRPFLDMDAVLVERFAKPIAAVFAEDGEPVFRAAESALCAELAQQSGLIISTGGGALVNPANRDALSATGTVICLTATVDEILARTDGDNDRPLMGADRAARRARLENLLAARANAYAAIPIQIDTTGKPPSRIIANILSVLTPSTTQLPTFTQTKTMTPSTDQPINIPVSTPTGANPIHIGDGLLAHVGGLLRESGVRPGSAAIVSNPDVAQIYAGVVAQSLSAAGFDPRICTVPEGEAHKTLASIASLYDQFLDAGLDRHSPIIALGGGVVGDMAGFAAASYLRGVPFVQIPTTLLSMVDASVGGKTGVDLPQGKNLVGAFKQPEVVIIDPAVLETLPAAEFRSGMAEVIKHGILADPALFAALEGDGPADLASMIADAVRVKVAVVQEDPFERGRRATLNLGHTFGHAIELVSQFRVRHGEGVGLGLVASAHMAAALGLCDGALAQRITALVERIGLPIHVSGYDVDEVYAAMAHDKKRVGKNVRFIVPRSIGDVILIDHPGEDVVKKALGIVLASK